MPSSWPAVCYLLLTPAENLVYDRRARTLVGSAVLHGGDLMRFCFLSDAEALSVRQALRRRGIPVKVKRIEPLENVA